MIGSGSDSQYAPVNERYCVLIAHSSLSKAQLIDPRLFSSTLLLRLIKLTPFSGKPNVTVWRPSVRQSVCLSRLFLTLIVTQSDSPGTARDVASVHFSPSIRRMDIFVD